MSDWSIVATAMGEVSWIHLTWKRYLERSLHPHGITIKQSFLLWYLNHHQGATPSQIAEILFCDRPTATSFLKTMTKRGWVAMRADEHDRRSKSVVLTTQGRRKLASLPPSASRYVPQEVDPLGGLNAAERRQLVDYLERIHAGMATRISDAPEPPMRMATVPSDDR